MLKESGHPFGTPRGVQKVHEWSWSNRALYNTYHIILYWYITLFLYYSIIYFIIIIYIIYNIHLASAWSPRPPSRQNSHRQCWLVGSITCVAPYLRQWTRRVSEFFSKMPFVRMRQSSSWGTRAEALRWSGRASTHRPIRATSLRETRRERAQENRRVANEKACDSEKTQTNFSQVNVSLQTQYRQTFVFWSKLGDTMRYCQEIDTISTEPPKPLAPVTTARHCLRCFTPGVKRGARKCFQMQDDWEVKSFQLRNTTGRPALFKKQQIYIMSTVHKRRPRFCQ